MKRLLKVLGTVFAVFLVVGVIGAIVDGGESSEPAQTQAPTTPPAPEAPPPGPSPSAPQAPPPGPVEPYSSYVEVTGSGEAMVSTYSDGSSSSTVQLPHRMELKEGYVSVSVTRSPSLESYMQGGGPDTGTVSCKIVRNGEVVDEQTASGEYASVSCSKFL